MREPNLHDDSWCLDEGEAYHADAPATFWLPERAEREGLQPGDFAKLIFRISLDNEDMSIAAERMWVLVRERTPTGYIGLLDNDPICVDENNEFWNGIEVPFAARHVIDTQPRDEASVAASRSAPRRVWPRS